MTGYRNSNGPCTKGRSGLGGRPSVLRGAATAPQPPEREAAMTSTTTKQSAFATLNCTPMSPGIPDMTWASSVSPSAALARQAARTTVKCWGLPENLAADAELIACELVTNAIRHSGIYNPQEPGRCRLTLERPAPDTVRVEVFDSSTTRPVKREPVEDETGGRGLVLVEALAVDWGVTRRPAGKTVWALLRAQP
ncbi:hypothetical protein SHKM778_17630 [Streptomyces sp. KM77-8]|uniref:Histidine kinase/HSP90-like ATPase domain-containing protein n=1 Tax=Streptomyces haneummycinicus TaxID=3074435 RepID=A0AAT9HDB2_9ACTN